MPITITLEHLPVGIITSVACDGNSAQVRYREFLSSEDGDQLIKRLEATPRDLLNKIPANRRPKPSQIDHLLAVIHKDKTATLYINELGFKFGISTKRKKEVGQSAYVDDLADIRTLEFPGVEIPNDAGIVFIFSAEWRKGLLYDLSPLHPNSGGLRDYNINNLLGQCYAYLTLQDRIKISEDMWEKMFAQNWFPFISLSSSLIDAMIKHTEIDDLLPKITGEVKQSLNDWLEKWSEKSLYKEHIEILRTAAERFLASDHHSAISILYPRIEGLLRDYHRSQGTGERQAQDQLVETAVQADLSEDRPKLPLLPEKFQRYLSEVYFGNFDPNQPEGVSRNTVSHGVAPVEAFSEKASVIGFLILDQLLYFFAE